jgi:dihydrofolate reductase
MSVKLIVAMCKNNGIGIDNKIPWRITEDMNYFSKKTSGVYGLFMKNKNIKEKYIEDLNQSQNIKQNVVIMGRKTWESLPKKYKPLPYRFNIILTKNAKSEEQSYDKDFVFSSSIDEAMDLYYGRDESYEKREKGEKGEKYKQNQKSYSPIFNDIWIIGGSSVYQEFIRYDMINNIRISKYYITYIDKDYDCDTYFPLLENMNKYHLTRFQKYKCIDMNTPNDTFINVYYIVFKKLEYTDEKIIQGLFTPYKSKNENKSNLTLYIKNRSNNITDYNAKIFSCINDIDTENQFEILFSMFCS